MVNLNKMFEVVLNSCWKDLDEESKYQIFPLLSGIVDQQIFYFNGDLETHSRIMTIFNKMAPDHTVMDLKQEYYKIFMGTEVFTTDR